MRAAAKSTVYLSDYLSLPMPTRASSHQAYLQKIRRRRILWGLIPYCVEAAVLLGLVVLTVVGASVFAITLGA